MMKLNDLLSFIRFSLNDSLFGPNYGVDRTMALNPKVRTNFGVENSQPHSSVGYQRLCTIGPNFGAESQSSYELWGSAP